MMDNETERLRGSRRHMSHLLLLAAVIVTNITPRLGRIGANYFDALKQSQVWINVEPQNLEPGPNPIELNITVSFTGRRLAGPPAAVDLRVSAYCQASPARFRRPVLTLIIDGAELGLGKPDLPLQAMSTCESDGRVGAAWVGAADAIVARIPFATFQRMAAAADVEMHALGFAVRLKPSDRQALQSFVTAVASGVAVR